MNQVRASLDKPRDRALLDAVRQYAASEGRSVASALRWLLFLGLREEGISIEQPTEAKTGRPKEAKP